MPSQFCKKSKSKTKRRMRVYRRNQKTNQRLELLEQKQKRTVTHTKNVISPWKNRLGEIFYYGLQFLLLPMSKIQNYITMTNESVPETIERPSTLSDTVTLDPQPDLRSNTSADYFCDEECELSSNPDINTSQSSDDEYFSSEESVYDHQLNDHSSLHTETSDDQIAETHTELLDSVSSLSISNENKSKVQEDDNSSSEDEEIVAVFNEKKEYHEDDCISEISIEADDQTDEFSIRQSLIDFLAQHSEFTDGSFLTSDVNNNNVTDLLKEFNNESDEFYDDDVRRRNNAPIARPTILPMNNFFKYNHYDFS